VTAHANPDPTSALLRVRSPRLSACAFAPDSRRTWPPRSSSPRISGRDQRPATEVLRRKCRRDAPGLAKSTHHYCSTTLSGPEATTIVGESPGRGGP
jgi:hypothetical protein